MKITSSEYLDQIQQNGKAGVQGPDPQQDQGFSKLMDTLKSPEVSGAAAGGEETAGRLLESASFVGLIMANQKISDQTPPAEKQFENALDKIEEYASALGDAGKTLKDIEPLANDLEKTAGRLSELSRNLPEGDPLKGLSNDAAVLATVEAMKFRRGDYI